MWTCATEKCAILVDDPPHMLFRQNQNLIQAFTAHASDESLANSIGFGRIRWHVNPVNASPFDSLVRTWPFAEGCRVAHLLGYPLIGWVARNPGMHYPPS
jgi:hypothetical protein